MSTSLPLVSIPTNAWVDLYSSTGITIGVQITIQNTGGSDVRLVESATQPTSIIGHNILSTRKYLTNATGSVGAWAYSKAGTTLQVEES